jgi:hypothetical protein
MKAFIIVLPFLIGNSASAAKFDWNNATLESEVTRCFRAKTIVASCDGPTPDDHGIKMSALEIATTDSTGHKFIYGDPHAVETDFCRREIVQIKKLIENTEYACLTGENEMTDSTKVTGSRWLVFETRRGEMRP